MPIQDDIRLVFEIECYNCNDTQTYHGRTTSDNDLAAIYFIEQGWHYDNEDCCSICSTCWEDWNHE
jgi:hypothetical protein